jgi:hypothetical protein
MQEFTLCHEIWEAANWQFDLKLTETRLNILALILAQVLRAVLAENIQQ